MSDEALREVSVGLGYVLILFGLTFVMAAMLIIVLDGPADQILGHAQNHSSTNASATGIGWLQDSWDALPLFTALLGFVQLLAGAVYESRRGR